MRTPRSEETKRKISEANRRFYADNPEKALERGAKLRGSLHYRWKGGTSRLNTSIRTMTENRRWMDAVKARDGRCVRCGATDGLEAHHTRPLADLVADLGIKSRDDARAHAAELWGLDNGETLCATCHYAEHGRAGPPSTRTTIFKTCPQCGASFTCRPSMANKRVCCSRECTNANNASNRVGSANPNWRGGRIERRCLTCDAPILLKPAEIKAGQGKYCSRSCRAPSRKRTQATSQGPPVSLR